MRSFPGLGGLAVSWSELQDMFQTMVLRVVCVPRLGSGLEELARCRCGLCEVNLDGWRLLFQRRRAGNGLVRFSGRALEVTLCAQTFFG